MVEKVIAKELSHYCNEYFKLHSRQIGRQKKRSVIDMVTTLIHTVQEKWEEKKLTATFFINLKGAFDHILKWQLIMRMIKLRIDGDLVMSIGSLLIDRKVQLVIDEHDNKEKKIGIGIPQGSPVSSVLFLIYMNRVLNKVLKTNPLVISLLFIYDLEFIVLGSLVKEIVKTLGKVAQAILK